jgi:CRP-like cAMP-binding protein
MGDNGKLSSEQYNAPPLPLLPLQTISDAYGNHIRNEILLGLSRADLNLLLPRLEHVRFEVGHVLHETGDTLRSAYFVNSGLVSLVSVFPDGKGIEVGLVGREGFIGLPLLVGFRTANTRAVVQIDGSAFRIDSEFLSQIVAHNKRLNLRLQQFAQMQAMEVTQIAACNRLHEVLQRLARWLLMSADRVASNYVHLTQESISIMLGTRRSSVTVAAGILETAGLITNSRGRIDIVDRARLEAASCDCYKIMHGQKVTWLKESNT